MNRRNFMRSLATASAAAAGGVTLEELATERVRATDSGTIAPVVYDSGCSLVDDTNAPLDDDSLVVLRAEDTATNTDADSKGDAVSYPDGTPIPLVAADWNVVGFGDQLVNNNTNWQYGNEQLVLNVFDDALGGSGTVLFDEGHGQYYTLSKFSTFEGYAEDNGYTLKASSALTDDLSGADAAVITSPATAFTRSELSSLGSFVDGGGWLFVFSQSDYGNYDETAKLNEILSYLGLGFRFNDDQVTDATNNAGKKYQPTTTAFNTAFPYFGDRSGLELERSQRYTVSVKSATDGDTVDVEFDDGRTENIRILGLDTPEKSSNSQYERIQEWEGIEDTTYLESKADTATKFAKNELVGKTVELYFDDESAVRDQFGRVLGYIDYDATGDGNRDAFYNGRILDEGLARVYDGSNTRHDALWSREQAAKSDGLGVWAQSDPNASSEIRNRAVDDLFFPKAASVRTTGGAIDSSRVPVVAESTAEQRNNTGVSYDSIPLVGLDESANTALVGAPLIEESYEKSEGFAVDTSTYENFVFLSNLIDYLTTRTNGTVYIDGGHGQFAADFGVTAEDAAYYLRYLEGQDVKFEGINDITSQPGVLTGARAYVVSTPASSFTTAEKDRLKSFVDDGGALVLLGDGTAPDATRADLDDVAAAAGSDLRLNTDAVVDTSNNVDGNQAIPTTTQFDSSFPLFDAYSSGSLGGSNSAPTASFTASSTSVSTGETVDFDASGSSDADGSISSYEWDFGDGATATGTTVSHSYSSSGDYTVTLTVTDDDGASGSAAEAVSVAKSNSAPTASFTASSTSVSTGETVDFDASGSSDSDGSISSYEWDFDDGATATGTTVSHSYSSSGDYTVTLTVTDDDGASGSAAETVSVTSSGTGKLGLERTHFDAEGRDYDNPNDEYVVFKNVGDGSLDLTGYAVEDEAAHRYEFPDGFSLDPGATVTLHSGSGTDTSTDLYWGIGSVWNNSGDTVYAFDDTGSQVIPSTGGGGGGSTGGDVAVASVHADAEGRDYDNPNDEYVVFENPGDEAYDLTGHAVEDEAAHRYEFPDGFSLDPGATVTLHSGSGTDTSTDLYWGYDSSLWNNSGDTAYVFDGNGTEIVAYTY